MNEAAILLRLRVHMWASSRARALLGAFALASAAAAAAEARCEGAAVANRVVWRDRTKGISADMWQCRVRDSG